MTEDASISKLIEEGGRIFMNRLANAFDPTESLEVDVEANIDALPHSTLDRLLVYLNEIRHLYDANHFAYMVHFIKEHPDWSINELFIYLNI